MSMRNKQKKASYHLKVFYTTCSVINKVQLIYLSYFFTDCSVNVYFSFLIKAFVSFEKLKRFHRQAFIVYKNKENLEILIEIFRQKRYSYCGLFGPFKT